jgi:hypothetical protein
MSALMALLLLQGAADAWTTVSRENGVTLESRPVTGSDYFEYRATADTDLPVEVLCDRVYEWGSLAKDHEHITLRRVLEDHGDTRVVYDQLQPPMTSGRDFCFTMQRTRPSADQCLIEFHATNEKAPPLPPGWVRIQKLHGSWRFVRGPNGTTRVIYTCFADPGGMLPVGIVQNTQRAAAVNTLLKGLLIAHQPRASLP